MPPRVLALILAVVMLLTGFAAAEPAVAGPALAFDQDHARVDAGYNGHGGPIDDDRTDDLPGQPQAESAQDLLLLETQRAAVEPALSVAPLHLFGLVALPSPFLEGPQRPPCSAPVLA